MDMGTGALMGGICEVAQAAEYSSGRGLTGAKRGDGKQSGLPWRVQRDLREL